jgi:hypothetical protein
MSIKRVVIISTGTLGALIMIGSGGLIIETCPVTSTIFLISLYCCIAIANHSRIKTIWFNGIWIFLLFVSIFSIFYWVYSYTREEEITHTDIVRHFCFFICFGSVIAIISLIGKITKLIHMEDMKTSDQKTDSNERESI